MPATKTLFVFYLILGIKRLLRFYFRTFWWLILACLLGATTYFRTTTSLDLPLGFIHLFYKRLQMAYFFNCFLFIFYRQSTMASLFYTYYAFTERKSARQSPKRVETTENKGTVLAKNDNIVWMFLFAQQTKQTCY